MFIEDKNNRITVNSGQYEFAMSKIDCSVKLTAGADKYLDFSCSPVLPCLTPENKVYSPEIKSVTNEDGFIKIKLYIDHNMTCEVILSNDTVSFQTSYSAVKKHELKGWQVFPEGTKHNYRFIDNLWNRPEENSNIWSYDARQEVKTTTGGANRIWAPHVSAIILRDNNNAVLFGTSELSPAFGLNYQSAPDKFDAIGSAVLDYGINGYGFEVEAHEKVVSPEIIFKFFTDTASEDIYADYYQNYKLSHKYPLKTQLSEDWFKPWYCTWADQYSISISHDNGHQGCLDVLDEQFVLRALDRIKTKELPIGTLIVDDGWQSLRGDWNVNKNKFPDMRKLTDTLHAAGLKVMLWWAPFCYDEQAEIMGKDWMFCEGADAHGNRMLDYSNPRVQDEYFKPLLNKIFSRWNFDGVKIDFLADRNHSTAKTLDREWHGQENYLLGLYRLIHEYVSSIKDDFCIYGTAQHPEFEPYQSIIGLEEGYKPDDIYIESRCALQKKLMPSIPVTAHFNYFCSSMKEFVQQARNGGGIVQIPPIFQDLSGYEPDEEYFAFLREQLR